MGGGVARGHPDEVQAEDQLTVSGIAASLADGPGLRGPLAENGHRSGDGFSPWWWARQVRCGAGLHAVEDQAQVAPPQLWLSLQQRGCRLVDPAHQQYDGLPGDVLADGSVPAGAGGLRFGGPRPPLPAFAAPRGGAGVPPGALAAGAGPDPQLYARGP